MATASLVLLLCVLKISAAIRSVLTATFRIGRRPPNRDAPDLPQRCRLGEASSLECAHDARKHVIIISHGAPERYSRDAVAITPYSTRRHMRAKQRGFEETTIKRQ